MTAAESTAAVVGRRVRRWRAVVVFVLAMIVVAVALAALRPVKTGGYLDPESPAKDGSRALAEILRQHGTPVNVVRSAGSASLPGGVVVVVRSERLTADDLAELAGRPGDLVLVEPGRAALEALAPGVTQAETVGGPAEPGCPLAEAAGEVSFDASWTYAAPQGAVVCFADTENKLGRVVQISTGGRLVTVLGSGLPLTNDRLADDGNAAFAMNLIGARPSAVWFMPPLPSEPGTAGDTSLEDLVPAGTKLFFWQVLIAVVLLALWRARRLGPVVAERLPVVVRSAETVEGRARLYRARRARDRAAIALRDSARSRLMPLLGLPRTAADDSSRIGEVVGLVAARSGLDQQTSWWALYGPDPADDPELVRLSEVLDDLEGRVLSLKEDQ
ncbi:DUF4350 domain-containing protein [Actinocorallia longicatena]|uniref:DUF4350 domain-containing protein n=1 Tax=Actinocorallia longicatena TaxID=111803 RepID=A0ABP6QMS8_9ACTN